MTPSVVRKKKTYSTKRVMNIAPFLAYISIHPEIWQSCIFELVREFTQHTQWRRKRTKTVSYTTPKLKPIRYPQEFGYGRCQFFNLFSHTQALVAMDFHLSLAFPGAFK
jgi:hypothetical protein